MEWSDSWMMLFNRTECEVLHHGTRIKASLLHGWPAFGQHSTGKGPECANRCLNEVQGTSCICYCQGCPDTGMIEHSFTLLHDVPLPLLVKTLDWPHLECGNLVLGPFNRNDQCLVERVKQQRTQWSTSDTNHMRKDCITWIFHHSTIEGRGRYNPHISDASWMSWCRPQEVFHADGQVNQKSPIKNP